jgi:hypothetical protein
LRQQPRAQSILSSLKLAPLLRLAEFLSTVLRLLPTSHDRSRYYDNTLLGYRFGRDRYNTTFAIEPAILGATLEFA